uniref:hypothetical protein n=1 Tax=Yoonia sp. TaxID=2212373 RepID=UPI0040488BED
MSTKARNWVFVENSQPGALVMALQMEGLPKGVRYICGQLEKGEHEHFQGYMQLEGQQRLSWLKKNVSSTAHFEAARGTPEENHAYCTKEETRVDGPWEWGTIKSQGQRTDLNEVKAALDSGMLEKDIADTYFNTWVHNYRALREYRTITQPPRKGTVETHVLYGGTGTGKSTYAKDNWPGAYYKDPQTEWWDGYAGEKVVILDEHNSAWFKWDTFLTYLNPLGTPVRVPYKGGFHQLLATVFIITSNVIPEEWYKKKDQSHMPALYRRISYFYTFFKNGEEYEHNKQVGYP